MADLTFGESLGLLETQEYSPWLQGIFDQIFYACLSRTVQYFPLVWMIVQRFIPKSLNDAAEASAKHCSERVDKRLTMGSDRPDIFGLIMRSEEGSKMPLKEMHSNADLLMIAGTETTATMLSGLTYNLLKNPEPMGRLIEEIRDTFQTDADITIDALPNLPVSTDGAIRKAKLTKSVSLGMSGRRIEDISVSGRRRATEDRPSDRRRNLWSHATRKRELTLYQHH